MACRRPAPLSLLILLIMTFSPAAGIGEVLEIDREASVFAVVTGKGGLAAGLAHNHLVIANEYTASLELDDMAPESARFEIELPTLALEIDDPADHAAWYPRLAELALVDEPFTELDEKKRAKIRKSMLSASQLAPEGHPTIRARISSIDRVGTGMTIDLTLTVRDREVTRPVSASYEWSGARFTAEAFGEFFFTDFGIKPFSAAFGTVKVQDEFRVYIYLEAMGGKPEPSD